jgi:hypothetical protein
LFAFTGQKEPKGPDRDKRKHAGTEIHAKITIAKTREEITERTDAGADASTENNVPGITRL